MTMPARTAVTASVDTLLDTGHLESIATAMFRNAQPFPWLNPEGVLRAEAFERLRTQLPPLELFKESFGRKRAHGQQAHDRYSLEYRPDLPVDPVWHQFIAELNGPEYQGFLARMFATRHITLTYHWHYTPRGCSVSPHCDAKRKLGSHIFYFSTEQDWQAEWGGETLILDDKGRFARNSAPDFEDFDTEIRANAMGNRSLLFQRRGNSWHGVRPLVCPEGLLRKVFIVVVNADTPLARLRRVFYRPDGY